MSTRLLLSALALGLLLALPACDKDDNDQGPDCNLPGADNLTYTLHIKRIIDEQCVSCHSGSGPGPGNYTTYEGLKGDLDNGDVLESVVIEKNMPQGGGMSQAQRDSINCWIKSGYAK